LLSLLPTLNLPSLLVLRLPHPFAFSKGGAFAFAFAPASASASASAFSRRDEFQTRPIFVFAYVAAAFRFSHVPARSAGNAGRLRLCLRPNRRPKNPHSGTFRLQFSY
jgi:hypothetical protein